MYTILGFFIYVCAMIIIRNAEERRGNAWAATVGFFDGVHQGHRFLIHELRRLADERGQTAAVFTFPVHPRIVLQANYQPKLLNSFDEKLRHLATTEADCCAVLDFTRELATLSAREFIEQILWQQWGVRTLLVGYDHRFGHNREEGFEAYAAYGEACGMEVRKATPYLPSEGEDAVSSSRIRQFLAECRVEEAAQMLTYPYLLKGHIVGGRQIGRMMGFPTANIEVDEPFKVWPGNGVYAVWVHLRDTRYKGMLSVGNRPTVDGQSLTVEVHLLHFSDTVYGEAIEVEFIHFVRQNRRFKDLEALKEQLEIDREEVDRLLHYEP